MRRLLFVAFILCASTAVDAQVALNVTAPTIDPGLPFELRVDVYNNSGAGLKDVTVNVTIPAGLQVTFVPAGCSQSAQTVSCLAANLPFSLRGGPQATFSLTALVDDSMNGATLPIAAEVRGASGILFTNTTVDARVFRTTFVRDAGEGLAAAINEVNRNCTDGYPCKIAFRLGQLPEPGWFAISPVGALPHVTGKNVSIDGTTQTRLTGDTVGNRGPVVYIDGTKNESDDAIVFDEPCEAEIAGLAIGNFRNAAVTMNQPVYPNLGLPCTETFPIRSVHDNYLGVTPSGIQPEPNGRGIVFNDLSQFSTLSNNLISANRRSGIWVGKAFWLKIAGNTIGLDVRHQPMGNGASGIYIAPQSTSQVDVRGNYIAFNHDFGVAVGRGAVGTDIGPNSIFANWQLGIDVGLDGPSPDRDIPAPTVLSARYDSSVDKTIVTATWIDDPNGNLSPILTIYASDAPHPSGYGDGQYLLGTFNVRQHTVTFAANGDWRGKWVAATLTSSWTIFPAKSARPEWEFTDAVSTTSEFSRAVKVE